MPGFDADKLSATRSKVLLESLETSNEPKFGYFGFPGPLCIGDDSAGGFLMKKPVVEGNDGEPIRNIQSAPTKKGMHPSVFFSFAPPLCLDDPYVDPHSMVKKGKVWMIDPDSSFKPAGKIKQSSNKLGYEYVPHMDNVKDPKAVKEALQGNMPLRQIYTAPCKKGGGGVLTNGVLMGWPENENRALPEHVPDDYDAAKKQRKADLDHHQKLLQELPWKSMAYGNNNFSNNNDTFGCEVPSHIPRDPIPDMCKPYPHEAAFRPANPMKKGALKGCCAEPPEWVPDPYPNSNVQRKPAPVGEVQAAFRVGAPPKIQKPTPSVTTLTRNMRNERPSSFARPLL